MPPMISPKSANFRALSGGAIKLPAQLQQDQINRARAAVGLTAPSVGQKAAQPGGLSSGQTNTIPPKYQATGTDTSATGNTTNASVTNNSGSMGALINAQNKSPFQVPVPQLSNTSYSQANNPIYPTSQPAQSGLQYAATPTILGGVATNLAQTAQQGSPAAQTYTGQTAQYGAGNLPIGQQAANILAQYGQQYNQIGQKGAAFESGERTTGTSPVASGNAAVTAQTTAAQQNAVAQGAQMALQGTGQELTAQNQAATAANEAAGQAVAQQGQQQTGLYQAGGLMAPGTATQQVGQGTTVLNAQGQPIATTPYIAPVGQEALYNPYPSGYTATGQPTPAQTPGYTIQSGDTFNALAAKYGTTAQAIEAANPGVNPNNLQPGQTINLPGQQGGNTPFTAGSVAGQIQLGQQVKQNQGTIQAAQQIQQKIVQDIDANNINPSALASTNFLNQWVQGQVSNPAYANFANDLNDYAATIAPLIGFGGNITDAKTFMAQQMTAGLQSGQTVKSVLDNLNSLMESKNAALQSAGLDQQGGSSTVTAGGYGFTQDASGRWVPKPS